MQVVIDYGAAGIAWVVTFVRFRTVIKSRSKQVLKAWSFALWFSLFVTFQIDVVYLAVNRLVGVNNFAWLISYLFLVLDVYTLCTIFYNSSPRWSQIYTIVTVVLFILTFPLGPGRAPETLDHVTPANLGELAFLGSAYFYTAIMLVSVPISATMRAVGRQQGYDRMRTVFILLALILTCLSIVTKVFIYSFGFFFPLLSPWLLNTITNLSRLWVAGIVVSWPLGLASNSFYRWIGRPAKFLQKICMCKDLGMLQAWLDRMFPPVSPERVTWIGLLKNPDLYIYQRTISILDRKKMLATWIEQNQSMSGKDLTIVVRIYQGIQSIPDTASIDQVIVVCRNLSKRIGESL